jgi:hypothetical protein
MPLIALSGWSEKRDDRRAEFAATRSRTVAGFAATALADGGIDGMTEATPTVVAGRSRLFTGPHA